MKMSLNQIQLLLHIDVLADFVNRRSVREKLLILGFSGILFLSLDYFLWLSPVMKSLSHTIPAYMASETELQNMRDDKKNETDILKRLERTEVELQLREKAIEAGSQMDTLLEALSKQAAQSGVRITSLSPLEEGGGKKVGIYSSIPIAIKATAGTHELGAFLSSLENGETEFKVLDLKVGENSQNQKKHLIEMKVETYRKVEI